MSAITPQFAMPRDMSGYSTLEAAMLQAIWAAGLPKPVAEWPFDRCCPHPKKDHRVLVFGEHLPDPVRVFGCRLCEYPVGYVGWKHAYRKGRNWRFDFAWPALKVAVECEGGTWSGGRHTRGAGFAADAEKYTHAALLGWLVIRVTSDQIEDGRALEWVQQALQQRTEADR